MDTRGKKGVSDDPFSTRRLQLDIKRKAYEAKRQMMRQREILAQRERGGAVRSRANASSVLLPRKHWSIFETMKSLEDRGKARNRLNGGYIAGDLSELQKTILLCPMCKHGFDWKKHQYYNVSYYDHINAVGRCDVCKVFSDKLALYLHEAYVGLSWTPRDRLRAQRRKAIPTH